MTKLIPIDKHKIYCLSERKYTPTKNQKLIKTKNGTLMIQGICVYCDNKKNRIVGPEYEKLLK